MILTPDFTMRSHNNPTLLTHGCKEDKGDKEDKRDKGDSTEKEKYICWHWDAPQESPWRLL
ncbi:MAG: hypothetical protein LDL41_00355 [Coleofasciculus sp. S288]|nr:hypothetical protein [Coleofasciculus sp. S288]